MAHTKGPWKIVGKQRIADGLGSVEIGKVWANNPDVYGNARLISCAPELLDALKSAHSENYLGHYVEDLIKRATQGT